MFQVIRALHFCYGHRLLQHRGKCKHLHGHNGRVEVILEATELDGLGMVIDFADVKRLLGRWLDEHLDHRTLLHRDDPLAPVLREHGEPVVYFECNPTAENIARVIWEAARELGLPVAEIRLWESDDCCAVYRGTP